MPFIFWDIKENPETKKTLAKKMAGVENKIKATLKSSSNLNLKAKLIFTNANTIKQLNKNYRKIDKETDVLSFAELDLGKDYPKLLEEKTLGEIYVNYDWIKKDKKPVKMASELFIHGYLHLIGYDHEKDHGKMEKLEKELQKMFLKKEETRKNFQIS